MANPKAEVEISAHSRNLGSKLREARSKFSSFGAEVKKNVFGKDASDHKATGQVIGNAVSSAGSAALSFLADQGRAVMDFNDKLTRLQITAEATPEEMQAFALSVRKASDVTGLSKGSIVDAGAAYVALTGDMATAQSQIGNWAKVAQATNATIADISSTAAALKQNMKIDPGDTLDAFGILAVQGKKGAIELKDLASQMANIAPQWAMFKGGTGLEGLKQMGASLQIAKRGFGGDASETVTGLQGMLTAFVKNSKRFHEAGVQIFDKDPKTGVKSMKNVVDILDEISKSKLIKDPAKLEKAFGRVEAYRAYLQLSQNRAELQGLIDDSGNAATIQKDLDTYLGSTAGKTKQAFEQAKNSIAEAFTPERIEAFAAVATTLVGVLGSMAAAAAKVLDLAKSAGENAAKGDSSILDFFGGIYGINANAMVKAGGGGESEEDRIKGLQAQRLAERKMVLRVQTRKSNPTISDDDREALVAKKIADEDRVRSAVQQGKHVGKTGQLEAGAYSPAELAGLATKAKGTSDEAATEQAIGIAIGAAIKGEMKMMADTIAAAVAKTHTSVKIGSSSIAEANRDAPSHRTRPAP